MEKIISKFLWIWILILSLPAVRYLFVDGFMGVSDDLHVGWLYQMDRTIKMLQFPPRFVPDLSYGFGYPLFNFVYPFPFYIAELFHLIGFSLVDSLKLVFGLSIPLSIFFMFKLLRVYMSPLPSLAGAILYVYAPYRALGIFVRGTVGEIVAFVLFPLIMSSYIKVTSKESSNVWITIASISTAFLILSHNIMAYMFMPFLFLFIVFRVWFLSINRRQFIVDSFKSIFLGLLMSSYFWVPAIFESKLMKYDTVFNFYDHFPTLKQLVTPYWGYGASVPGSYDTMSFYVGIIGIMVILIGLISFFINLKKFSREEKVIIFWSFVVLIVSVFMMNHRSAFLWYNLPFLPYFQFPWRFLAMITLVVPLFLIVFYKLLNKKYINVVFGLIMICAIVFNFNYFKYSEYLGRTDEYYLNRYIPSLSGDSGYSQTSEEYLRLPKDSKVRPNNIYPRAYTETKDVNLEIIEISPLDAKIKTKSKTDFVLNYNKYNYPGWKVSIDGRFVEIKSGEPYGQISFLVPGGDHEIVVQYRESSFRMIFNIISLITLFTLVILLIRKNG